MSVFVFWVKIQNIARIVMYMKQTSSFQVQGSLGYVLKFSLRTRCKSQYHATLSVE